MKKLSIDKFYKQHESYLAVTAGYMEEPTFPFMLRACRMRPIQSHNDSLPVRATLLRNWADEYGNTLYLGKNKRSKVCFGDLSLDRSRIRCTDLYASISIEDLWSISRLLYCCIGIDDCTEQEVFILSFLGKDNYFRTRVYQNGNWDFNVSSLILNQYVLRMICENHNIKHFLELSARRYIPYYPLRNVRHWVTALPAHHKFRQAIISESETMSKVIGLDSQELI